MTANSYSKWGTSPDTGCNLPQRHPRRLNRSPYVNDGLGEEEEEESVN